MKNYAVVDIETTGGIARRDKITEIAIVLCDGKNIIDSYATLINPERSIPPEITRITGITNNMVSDAPKFFEVAKKVVELTQNAVFVAHNVRFDYAFLREEFKALGYTYTRRNLCTVKLSRQVFPGLRSYSLGSLIRHFNIQVENRHRALDDAMATTDILFRILSAYPTQKARQKLISKGVKLTKLPRSLTSEFIEALPEACGVYYFMNESGRIIYVGKSKNIRDRVKQHFSKYTRKTDKLLQTTSDISYEVTGSELAALIKESYDIKEIQPEINRIQRNSTFPYHVVIDRKKGQYHKFEIIKDQDPLSFVLSSYSSRQSARSHIKQLSQNFELCLKVNGLDNTQNSCFEYKIGKCRGACVDEETISTYNERFALAAEAIQRTFEDNFIIIEEGRTRGERCVFVVEDGHFRGFGFIEEEDAHLGLEEIKESILYTKINPEADMLIRSYLWSNDKVEIIPF